MLYFAKGYIVLLRFVTLVGSRLQCIISHFLAFWPEYNKTLPMQKMRYGTIQSFALLIALKFISAFIEGINKMVFISNSLLTLCFIIIQ
jgi:hypothetical protein